jgi:hypothetical protein
MEVTRLHDVKTARSRYLPTPVQGILLLLIDFRLLPLDMQTQMIEAERAYDLQILQSKRGQYPRPCYYLLRLTTFTQGSLYPVFS